MTHDLMVGVNCGGSQQITEVDPDSGAVTSSIPTTGVSPSHLMADVAGNAWYSADGCGTFNQGMVAFGSSSGTTKTFTGDDTYVNTLIWNLNSPNENLAYYTSSGCCGGNGHFGTLDVATGVTTCVKSSGTCVNFPGAHGGFFDPYTGDLIIVGGNHITQIDPNTLAVVSDLFVSGVTFDQGSADGNGHLFVANNGGSIYFLDYSASHLVGAASNFAYNIGGSGVSEADDVAPLVGQGSTSTGVPEFPLGPVLLVAIAIPVMLVLRQRVAKLPVSA
ncbi:MAG: hypothetical protein OK456_10595, partial [Thaumarchaeota archaeon]|nr:hypothetical protein [Nitrososphaerota archaeon]